MKTADSYGMPAPRESWPDVGEVIATCIKAERCKARTGTQGVRLTFTTPDLQYQFSDTAYVTPKTASRLNMIAQHLCHLPKTTPVPEKPGEAVAFFAKHILENAVGNEIVLVVEVEGGTYMDSQGNTRTSTRKKVAFDGYKQPGSAPAPTPNDEAIDAQDDDGGIPF